MKRRRRRDITGDGNDADDVVVGDLDLINDVQLFEDIWITNASVAGYDTLILDVDAGELQDGNGDAIFTTDAAGSTQAWLTRWV